MIKIILKSLLALALSIGICYLGYWCGEELFKIPTTDDVTFRWVALFMGVYLIIIKPTCDYWTDKISDLLDLKTD